MHAKPPTACKLKQRSLWRLGGRRRQLTGIVAMRKILKIAVVFAVSFFAIGFCPLIELRKGADFVLGYAPLLAAYSTPVKAWQSVLLHVVLSALAVVSVLAIVRFVRGCFQSHKDLRIGEHGDGLS